jgi:Cd2+/Zn2+-exporting ATPase/Cu+-exporting ATPase
MVGIALASMGLLSPTLAAFIHVTSELAFILNSARLLPRSEQSSKPATNDETREITLAKAA